MTLSIIAANIYPGFSHIEFMMRNLADQTYRDFELIFVDAQYKTNAAPVKELGDLLGLRVIHTPAMEARHVGRLMHWELYNNALMLASNQWVMYHGVYRYLLRRGVEAVAERASHGACTSLYQLNVSGEQSGSSILDTSADSLESSNNMDLTSEQWPYLSTSGFFSAPRDVIIRTLNGYNEALVFHHWADCDFSSRAQHLRLNVDMLTRALLRINHSKDSAQAKITPEMNWPYLYFPECKLPCLRVEGSTCVAWLIESLREDRHIEAPVKRISYGGFEWVQCGECGMVGVEDDWLYMNYLAREADPRAPINLGGIGRNLARLDDDLVGLSLSDKIVKIQASHDHPRYLEK